MKAIKLFHEDGKLLTKQEACQLYNQKYNSQEQIWLITDAVDAFGHNSHGCLNLTTGEWEYFRENEFEIIDK